jgi:Sulfatase
LHHLGSDTSKTQATNQPFLRVAQPTAAMFVRPISLFLCAVLVSATLGIDSNETSSPSSVPSTQYGSSEQGAGEAAAPARPNLLVIMTDQQRWDAMGFVQARLAGYANKVKIKTPNLDELVKDSVDFSTAYCVCPLCVPSRASMHTGSTMKRTGMTTIQLMLPEYYNRMKIYKERIENLTSLERVLSVQYVHDLKCGLPHAALTTEMSALSRVTYLE